jgi:hypothetical protein
MKLSDLDRERTAYHLGYDMPNALAPGILKRFNESSESIYSNHAYWGANGIKYWLDRCDRALAISDVTRNDPYSFRQQIIGDVNRTTLQTESRDLEAWWEFYLMQTDELAYKLNVYNLKRFPLGDETTICTSSEYVEATIIEPDNSRLDAIMTYI